MQKTRDLLHEALASLIHEKSYDDIVVKEILARANVGRSTFYAHFRDKDELLDSSIRDMLDAGEAGAGRAPARAAQKADHVLRFSLPVLEHIERHRRAGSISVDPDEQGIVHDRLEEALAELIANDLRRVTPPHRTGGQEVPRDLLARHVASTFLVVLSWWLSNDAPLAAAEVDRHFRALVLPALVAAVE